MRTFARIDRGVVAELFTTACNIGELFNPALLWMDVTETPEVGVGWLHDGTKFRAPDSPTVPPLSLE